MLKLFIWKLLKQLNWLVREVFCDYSAFITLLSLYFLKLHFTESIIKVCVCDLF